MESNQCRLDNKVYRVNDYCWASLGQNIKREIFKNGPVVGQMVVHTNMLAYKEGSYHRAQDAFRYPGVHIAKIVGWSSRMDGDEEWIVENSWGEDWGENGYVRVLGGA